MDRTYYPALRAEFGDWVYYSSIVPVNDVALKVNFAKEIHKSKQLSQMIQRELRSQRTIDIAKYLGHQKQRFFNSLVVAVYEGEPSWHQFGNITPEVDDIEIGDVDEKALDSVGFLSFYRRREDVCNRWTAPTRWYQRSP